MVGPQIEAFAAKHGLKRISVAELIAYRQAREKLVERVATLSGQDPDRRADRPRLSHAVRHGAAFRLCPSARSATAATCRRGCIAPTSSATFSAPASIDRVLQRFKDEGRGVLVYLRDGAAGVPANLAGAAPAGAEGERATQWREIGLGAQILRDLGVSSIRLRTGNPRKYVGLSGFGIEIAAIEPIDG